jgi:hypothetical protein
VVGLVQQLAPSAQVGVRELELDRLDAALEAVERVARQRVRARGGRSDPAHEADQQAGGDDPTHPLPGARSLRLLRGPCRRRQPLGRLSDQRLAQGCAELGARSDGGGARLGHQRGGERDQRLELMARDGT